MSGPTIQATIGDKAVQDAVEEELDWAPEVNAAHVGVSVDHGAVTLSGQVDSLAERIGAKKAALRVKGVTAVADDLIVHQDSSPRTDTDIAQAVERVLEWTTGIPVDSVKADVRDRTVTLTGQVEWNFQRDIARKAVERVYDVLFVDNRITLKRRPSAPDTSERIKNALVRYATIDANAITVSVDSSEVTLNGTVRSWAEKKQAGLAAWSSPNVTTVHNEIVVSV